MEDRFDVPVGPRLEAILEVAYRARRPVLLEGATGIGKSEIVRGLAKRLGIGTVVLDLSLLEPPDLVGLPVIENGRTHYAAPSILPTEGRGILLLEELNRAERYIQQPALQLLSARALHEYVLPEGYTAMAAINPATADYQVTPLDPALLARFLHVRVRADRAAWLTWALDHRVHGAIVELARRHERIFESASPRSFTYASEVLKTMTPEELANERLVRDLLGGYLPPSWVEAILALGSLRDKPLELDVHELLARYDRKGAAARAIRGYLDRGETDAIDELVTRLDGILRGPEAGVLAEKGRLELDAFEALLADLPGDYRERLQDGLGGNPLCQSLLGIDPHEVLSRYASMPLKDEVARWAKDPLRAHRVRLLVTVLGCYIDQPKHVAEIRKRNPMRASLGHLLVQLGERYGLPLVDILRKNSITPIRPT